MTLRVVYKAPGRPPEVREVSDELHVLQGLVEGYLEHVGGFTGGYALFCNEHGKLKHMRPNIIGPYDVIVGPIFISKGDGKGNLVSLTDRDVKSVMATLEGIDLPDRHALCPRCNKYALPVGHVGALSRADDATEVCSVCGTDEALVQFMTKGTVQAVSEWPVPLTYEEEALQANPGAEVY